MHQSRGVARKPWHLKACGLVAVTPRFLPRVSHTAAATSLKWMRRLCKNAARCRSRSNRSSKSRSWTRLWKQPRFKLDSAANFRNFWTAYDPFETRPCFATRPPIPQLYFFFPVTSFVSEFLYFPVFSLFTFSSLFFFPRQFFTFCTSLLFRFASFLTPSRALFFSVLTSGSFLFSLRMSEDVTWNFMHRHTSMRDACGTVAVCKIFRWDLLVVGTLPPKFQVPRCNACVSWNVLHVRFRHNEILFRFDYDRFQFLPEALP